MPDKSLTRAEIAENRKNLRFVKPWLNHRGLNQRELAERMTISEPTVSKWLAGTQSMTVAQFHQIAAILDAKPEELMFAPPAKERATRYRRLAELAGALSDEDLERVLEYGRLLTSRPAP